MQKDGRRPCQGSNLGLGKTSSQVKIPSDNHYTTEPRETAEGGSYIADRVRYY